MMENQKDPKEMFRAALLYLLSQGGRGTQMRLSRAVKIASTYITDIKGGKRPVSSRYAEGIARFFEMTYEEMVGLGRWILSGKDPEQWQSAHTRAIETEPSFIQSMRELNRVPVISLVQAGTWQDVEDNFRQGYAENWVDTTATSHPNAFALVVRGDSMEPLFLEGETIIVDPGKDAISGSYVIVKNGEMATFKQLVIDGGGVFLKPLNNRYPIMDMTGVEFKIVGVVVAKEMRFYP
ncbi:LexA family transcriptional regulator [Desulfosarcina sp. OttesenSCG-928-A07]|nr:LexA family transcriptional regulator [Desulfosarcina sp. OttesenSCG-928-G17]MDL2329054.1 LexA family transcriptional regulator [Desulfosarcina sp. OttesenSCG-928-A07]